MLRYVFIFLISTASARTAFRSVLLERACLKRPSLDFCSDVSPATVAAPSSTTTTEATTTIEVATTTPKLIPPPVVTDTIDAPANASKSTAEEELGTLLRLPKPSNITHAEEKAVDPFDDSTVETNSTAVSKVPPPEDEKTVLVYISEYCVVERERFVKTCHGEVKESEMSFCKAYPPACASAPGVLPVISYCQRYYKQYPKFCAKDVIPDSAIQFCYAFEQFCLPELTPAQPAKQVVDKPQPKGALKRCEDVVDEARKVCNPFPHPKDTFNVIRCSNFLTNCREFIDWS